LTARAAILVLAVASVMVAVAVPFKIWLGQRHDIASLVTQTHRTEVKLSQLHAQDRRWQNPAYVESQARQRLHYMIPGQTTYVVLGKAHRRSTASTHKHQAAVSAGPWYSQLWQSMQSAGAASSSK
jgi:cell division protein FtsB